MSVLILVTSLILCGLVAKKATAASPVRMTERGSAVLVWLETHKRPGTPRSRARLAAKQNWRIWTGLRRGGFIWGNAETGGGAYCLHRHEGVWNDNNSSGNGYYGGLQQDVGFMTTYGREYIRLWGYANNWPIWAQMVAGYRAYHGYHGYGARGFSPWGTRGLCGL